MRQGPNPKRSRGRNNNNNNNNNRRPNAPMRMQTYDSNGPDVRIRGSAYQVHEKYLQLARDASSSGDRIMLESYLQHAEHYYRIIAAMQEQQNTNEPNRPQSGGYGPDYRGTGRPGDEMGNEEYAEGEEGGQPQPGNYQQPQGGGNFQPRGDNNYRQDNTYRQQPDTYYPPQQDGASGGQEGEERQSGGNNNHGGNAQVEDRNRRPQANGGGYDDSGEGHDAPRQHESRQNEPRQQNDRPQNDRQHQPRQDRSRQYEPRQDAPRQEGPRQQDESRQEAPRQQYEPRQPDVRQQEEPRPPRQPIVYGESVPEASGELNLEAPRRAPRVRRERVAVAIQDAVPSADPISESEPDSL